MMSKKQTNKNDAQLSLFESNDPVPTPAADKPVAPLKEPTVLELVRARFEYGPEMNQEDYRRWIKILISNSLKSMD